MTSPPPCAWCLSPATNTREVEPPVYANKILVRRAISVGVCDEHAAMVDRNVRARELEREVRRLEGTLKRPNLRNPEAVEKQLERARVELRALTGVAA